MKGFLFLWALILPWLGSSTPVTDQIKWPDHFLPGYLLRQKGNFINYHGPVSGSLKAMVVRADDSANYIEWLTDSVIHSQTDRVSFLVLAGMDINDLKRTFSVSVNGEKILEFQNPQQIKQVPWKVKGIKNTEMVFWPTLVDKFGDEMGFAWFTIPVEMIQMGKPQTIRITGESTGVSTWFLVYEYRPVEYSEMIQDQAVIQKEGSTWNRLWVRIMRLGDPEKVEIRFPDGRKFSHTNHPGLNEFPVLVPGLEKEYSITAIIAKKGWPEYTLTADVKPVKPWTIFLVQHTHTDIGYTRPQSEILPEHLRYIDFALDYCDLTDHLPDDARFRWTCETSWAVKEYIRSRPESQVNRLVKRVMEGRIEVAGMLVNLSDMADEASLSASLQPIAGIRAKGIPVRSAMQDDVNGIGWCLADYLPGIGIDFISMGQNTHRALKPFPAPSVFWWVSPSGSKILTYRGEHYMWGNGLELLSGDMDKFGNHLFVALQKLEKDGYIHDAVPVHFSGYFTDNSPPSTIACKLVQEWNEKYEYPHLRLATVHEFADYVKAHPDQPLPVYQAAWPDWWTDGFGSAAIETAYTRNVHTDFLINQSLLAMAALKGAKIPENIFQDIKRVAENLLFYDEHTFGAAESISDPSIENSVVQWGEKSSYVWEALKLNQMVREKAMGLMHPWLTPDPDLPVIWVFNTLGVKRVGVTEVFIDHEILPVDVLFRMVDGQGREAVAQPLSSRAEGTYWTIQVPDLDPFSATKFYIQKGRGILSKVSEQKVNSLIENDWYIIKLDTLTGRILNIVDRQLGKDLVDPSATWGFGEFIYEQLGRNRQQLEQYRLDTVSRTSWTDVKITGMKVGPVWQSVFFRGYVEGCSDKNGINLEMRIYKKIKKIDFIYSMRKLPVFEPEGVYISFPFNVPDGKIMFEVQGGLVQPGKDQLEGSSSDWNGIQNFVAIRNNHSQIVLSSPEIPLIMTGDINLGKYQYISDPQSTHIYSWVLNNYWTTNFRASQEGELKWTYSLTSSRDTTLSMSSRFGWENRIELTARVLPPLPGSNKLSATLEFSSPDFGTVLPIKAMPSEDGVVWQLREYGGTISSCRLPVPDHQNYSWYEVNAIGEKIRELKQGEPVHFDPWEPKFIKLSLHEKLP